MRPPSAPEYSKLHLLSLTRIQQAALRFCMFHFVSTKLLGCLQLANSKPKDTSIETISDGVVQLLYHYDVIVNQWPLIQDQIKSDGLHLYYLDEENFNLLDQAVNAYNSDTARIMLGSDTSIVIDAHLGKIRDILNDSKKYTYSMKEIRAEIMKVATEK